MKKFLAVLAFSSLLFVSCLSDDAQAPVFSVPDPPVINYTSGDADFSKYVAIGNSLTAGFTDGAVFLAAQENSFPNSIAKQFANAGGGEFFQPLVNGNFGGLALAGNRIADPRLVFGGAGPVPLEAVIGPVTVATDITSNPTGPFNNLGVPGAKSFHIDFADSSHTIAFYVASMTKIYCLLYCLAFIIKVNMFV